MTVSITIRHVPNATRDALAARAARSGRSLQEHLLGELQRLASTPSVDEWLHDARASAARSRSVSSAEIVAEIDQGRR